MLAALSLLVAGCAHVERAACFACEQMSFFIADLKLGDTAIRGARAVPHVQRQCVLVGKGARGIPVNCFPCLRGRECFDPTATFEVIGANVYGRQRVLDDEVSVFGRYQFATPCGEQRGYDEE